MSDLIRVKRELQSLKSEDGQYVLSTLASIHALPKLIEFIAQETTTARMDELEYINKMIGSGQIDSIDSLIYARIGVLKAQKGEAK